jgi:hypothetical protein
MGKVIEKVAELEFLIKGLEQELSESEYGSANYLRLKSKLDEYYELLIKFRRLIKRKN